MFAETFASQPGHAVHFGPVIAMVYAPYAAPVAMFLLWSSAYHRLYFTTAALFIPAVFETWASWTVLFR